MTQLPDSPPYRAQLPNVMYPTIQPSLVHGTNSLQPIIFSPTQTPHHLASPHMYLSMVPRMGNQQSGVTQTGGRLHVTPNLPAPNAGTAPMLLCQLLFTHPCLQVLSPKKAHGSKQKFQPSGLDKIPNCGTSDMTVQEKYQLWRQYKELLRKSNFTMVEIDVFACFMIRAMRSLSQCSPIKGFSEYVSLAVEEWMKTGHCDRTMFVRATKIFKEFEMGVEMRTGSPKHDGMGTKMIEGYESPVEEAAHLSKEAETVTSAAPGQRKRIKHCQHGALSEIFQEAVEYCTIMDEIENEQEESKEDDFDLDMLTYVNTLCGDPQFISQVERIIDPDFIDMILSPNATMDCEQYITMQEEKENVSLRPPLRALRYLVLLLCCSGNPLSSVGRKVGEKGRHGADNDKPDTSQWQERRSLLTSSLKPECITTLE